jgi:hypothetical protein
LHPWNRKRRAKCVSTFGTAAIVCFQGFPLLRKKKRVFDFASVRHITRQREFFGAILRGFSHLGADRDHDWT